MFLTTALRLRDSRSLNVAILTFNRLLPSFRKDSEARRYIVDAVLKASITSFNEPYFTDSQTKLAGLIAQIISLDEGASQAVVLSLPGLNEEKVLKRFAKLRQARSPNQGAGVVLEMLQGLRGVSIHELGKITQVRRRKSKGDLRGNGGVEMGGVVTDGIQRGGEEGLEGVAGMFGQGG
jgi:exportin-5